MDPAATPNPLAHAAERELDSMYGPLVYLMRPEERGIYPSLSLAGKPTMTRKGSRAAPGEQ